MKLLLRNKIIISILMFMFILIISNISSASKLELNNLNYDVQLNSDGSANVTETWKIDIENTNTLFKTFEVDKTKYEKITDVTVSEIKNNIQYNFSAINYYQYHVDKDKYYALVNNEGKFEIAWGINAKNTVNTYKISYKIVGAVKNYNDISEFYWQFIGIDSAIPAKSVTGIINLPIPVKDKADLKVWAHGPLNGNIQIKDEKTVVFEVFDFPQNTMLETRVVVPNEIFPNNAFIKREEMSETIIKQETLWAEEANQLREARLKEEQNAKDFIRNMLIISNVLGIIITLLIIKKKKKYKEVLTKNPKIVPEFDYTYYRDIPDENTTPAQASFLYYFNGKNGIYSLSKVITATMLDLCLKGYISFETILNKKNQFKIILNNKNIELLSEDERIVYELLEKVPKKDQNEFTMKEFQKYINAHSTTALSKIEKIEEISKKLQTEKKNYDKNLIEKANKWYGKAIAFLFGSIFSIFLMQTAFIGFVIGTVYCFKIAGRFNRLTEKGINEMEQWVGLRKFMLDFSSMKEKEVPELILWEKYLVYATAFGIADKVLKQLKIVYPQINDTEFLNSSSYSYLHMIYAVNFSSSLINTLDTSLNNTYSSLSNYSSGSGMGGGFSSGGGFGGGGGRNGRKIRW